MAHPHPPLKPRKFVTYEQIKDTMVSKQAPFGLWKDLPKTYVPKIHPREPHVPIHKWCNDIGKVPWEQDLEPWRSSRGPGIVPRRVSNTTNAPFGTSHNVPPHPQFTGDHPEAPWDREENYSIMPIVPCMGPAFEHHQLSSTYSAPWASFVDVHLHPKEPRLTQLAYPISQQNESSWNRERLPRPARRSLDAAPILFPSSHTAPFATLHNRVVLQPRKGKAFQWPWDRDEEHHNRVPESYPRDPATFVPYPIPYAYEPKKK